MPPEPEKTAALTPEDSLRPRPPSLTHRKAEIQAAESTSQKTKPQKTKPPKSKPSKAKLKVWKPDAADASPAIEAAPVPADTPAPVAIADAEIAPPSKLRRRRTTPLRRSPSKRAPLSRRTLRVISTKIATLGGPPVDRSRPQHRRRPRPPATKKRVQARRAARRRRLAQQRARLAAQTIQAADPFGTDACRRSAPLKLPLRPGRSRPAVRRACPIRTTSHHTARCRARRGGTAPASAPARRRRSRRWSRSAWSDRGRRP